MIVVEIFCASPSGKGPSEMTQAVKAMLVMQNSANAITMTRTPRAPPAPGPGLPDAQVKPEDVKYEDVKPEDVKSWDVKPEHDDGVCKGDGWLISPSLISPRGPRLPRCRCGHSVRDYTYPPHRPAVAHICQASPHARHRQP